MHGVACDPLYYNIICTYYTVIYSDKYVSTCIQCHKTLPEIIPKQWRKKMFLNRGAVNKIACKARKKIFLDHAICLQTMPIIMLIWL